MDRANRAHVGEARPGAVPGAGVRSGSGVDRHRRKRRWGRLLLILVLVLLVLLVAADRIGAVVAEHEIAKQARTQLAGEDITVAGDPSVSISGFPFLTQVASGTYQKINIVVSRPSSKGISLDKLDISATGVHAPTRSVISGTGQIEADKVVGTGSLGWGAFTELVDLSGLHKYGIDPTTLDVTGTSDGQITISAPVSVSGRSFRLLATGVISVTHDVVHVQVTNISAADDPLPPLLSAQLRAIEAVLTFDARIPVLPYHLVLESVRATSGGISISASATHVVLAG